MAEVVRRIGDIGNPPYCKIAGGINNRRQPTLATVADSDSSNCSSSVDPSSALTDV
jgi:hypothetical protein